MRVNLNQYLTDNSDQKTRPSYVDNPSTPSPPDDSQNDVIRPFAIKYTPRRVERNECKIVKVERSNQSKMQSSKTRSPYQG